MGNSDSKASDYVRVQWVDDKEAPCCFNCGKAFNVARRRHHCRCCGQVFDEACWGTEVLLPEQYGYDDRQPVCRACERLIAGDLLWARHPRRIVMTRALRGNKKAAQPPLSAENVRARSFEVFFMRVAHWRPLGCKSQLQFSVTFRTANAVSSSAAIADQKLQWIKEQNARRLRSGVIDFQASDDAGTSPSVSCFLPPGAGGDRFRSCRPPAGVQLDVAWVLPMDAILQVLMDHHDESDYICIETAQETYRIQVADITVHAEHDDHGGSEDSESDGGPTESTVRLSTDYGVGNPTGIATQGSAGSTSKASASTPPVSPPGSVCKKKVTVVCGPSRGHIDEAESTITSQPVVGATYTVNEDATRELHKDLQSLIKLVGERERAKSQNARK